MLKVMDYLTKEKISSEASEEVQRAKQVDSRRKALRFKRSDDNPELPENFKVGQAIGGGDCFFDSVVQGLKRLKPEMDFTVKSLREVCKRFAQSQLENDQSWLKGALRNEAEPISVYVPRIEFTADDIEQKSGSVNVLGLTSPIWGRSEIEGRIICKEYNVKLHVVEKHVVEGKEVWLDQIVNSEGSRSVDSIDYNEENTIHIINRGNAHFEPILHNRQQSSNHDTPEKIPDEEQPKMQERPSEASRNLEDSKKKRQESEQKSPVVLADRLKRSDNDPNQPGLSNANQKSIQPNNDRQSGNAKDKSKKGSDEGKIYEKLSLALLAERGYELSKREGSKYRDFSIGREVDIGKEGKFDDIVFKYKGQDNKNNLMFVQIKHKQDDYKINSDVLSTEASRAKGGLDGGMARDFNLQKYFISYLNTREELKVTKNKNIKDGKMKYIAIFTNVALDTVELGDKGFTLGKANDDIATLFTLKAQKSDDYYQLISINDELHKILEKSSDLHRTAKELAKYVVWEKYRQEKIMGIDAVPIKHYHAVLKEKVINKSDEVFTDNKNKQYCEGRFKNDFIDNDEPGSKELRDAILEAIRELDDSKRNSRNDELKKILKEVSWRLVPNFGATKQTKVALPDKWKVVSKQDITDFLKYLVFIVNQPRVQELEALTNSSTQDTILKDTQLRQVLDKIESTGPEFRQRIEKVLGIDQKIKYIEKWISGEEIVEFIQEQKQVVDASFIVTAMALIYESEVMQYGSFNKLGKLIEILDTFLQNNDKKVLCINTQETLLSSIKILQYFSTKEGYKAEDGRISMSSEVLKGKENRDSVIKAFESGSNNLLIIECRHTVQEKDSEELYNRLSSIMQSNSNKKVILITQEQDPLAAKFKKDSSDKYIEKRDEKISLTDLTAESQEKFLKEGKVIFQKEEVSLGTLVGDESKHLVDGEVLSKLVNSEEIQIGKAFTDSKYDDVKDYYVDRTFNRQVKIKKGLKEENCLLLKFFVIYSSQVHEQELKKDQDILLISDTGESFKELCNKYEKHNIHWLKEEGNDLIWQQSYGALSKLRKFVYANERTIQEYKSEKITKDRVVIISDEPGMGKSTVLMKLAQKTKTSDPSLWVVRINLVDYSTTLKREIDKKTKLNEAEAIKFLYRIVDFQLFQEKIEETIEKVLSGINVKDSEISFEGAGEEIKDLHLLEIGLFNNFYNQGKIALLFDGFDEISPDYTEKVIELLQVLKNTKVEKLWITTRPYNAVQENLENQLSVFSYSLKPLLSGEQKDFLKKFWKAKLKLSELDEQRSGVFIDELLDRLPRSIGDKDFMSIPLHAFMVAEVFIDAFKSFYDSNEKEVSDEHKRKIEELDLATLYERFIDIKFYKIRFGEKKPGMNIDDPDMKGLIENKHKEFIADHMKLALYAIFNEDEVKELLSQEEIGKVTELIENIKQAKEKTGIIDRIINDKPRFVHRTFAEYFVASYFWESFNSVQFDKFEDFVENIIIKNLIKDDDRIEISKFLQLKAKKDLESNINFPDKQNKLRTLLTKLLDQTTQYDYNGNGKQSTKLLFGIVEFSFSTKEKSNIDVIENNDQLKLLCVSAEMGYIKLVEALETKLNKEFLQKYLKFDKWFYSPLWLAAQNDHLDVLEVLVKKFSCDPNWKDKDSQTLVQCIFKRNEFDVLRSCLKLDIIDGKPYEDLNYRQELPIVAAFNEVAPSDVIKLLIEKTDSNLVNGFNCPESSSKISPIQMIIIQSLKYGEEITEFAIKKGIDFSDVTNLLLFEYCHESLNSPINKLNFAHHWSPSFHSDKEFLNLFKKIELLLKAGVGYNHKDIQYSKTTLQYAEQIHYIHKLLYGVHKFHTQKVDKSSNPLGTILKLIVDNVGSSPDFKDYEFVRNYQDYEFVRNYQQRISLLLNYKDKSSKYNKGIPLLPNNIPKLLFEFYEDSNVDLVKNALGEFRNYITNAKEAIEAFKQYPDKVLYDEILIGYGEMIEFNRYQALSPHLYHQYKSLDKYKKDLLERVLNLYIRQDYEINDALKEVVEEVLRFKEIINKLEENSGHKKYETGEILDILAIKSIDTNEELQDLISKIYECGGIQFLSETWLRLNLIGQQRIMGILELMFKFADQSSKIFELLKKLDDSYKTLTKAIKNKNYQEIDNILQNIEPDFIKATISGQDDKYGSPLHYAACKGDVEATQILLKHKADPNLRMQGHDILFSTADETQKDEDLEYDYQGCTPLHLTVLNDQLEVAEILVNYGADVNAMSDWQGTPLHMASESGKLNVIKFLVAKGADVNVMDTGLFRKKTPLHIAAQEGYLEVVQLLLGNKADPNIQDKNGKTPLDLAEEKLGQNRQVYQKIVDILRKT